MTETERKHSIEALTSGAMAETWVWVQKKLAPAVEPALDRAFRAADALCDLADGHTVQVEETERLSLLTRQPAKGALDVQPQE